MSKLPPDRVNADKLPAWLAMMKTKLLYAYRVYPGREAKVMSLFETYGLDGYAPTMPKRQLVTQRSRWNDAERRVARNVRVRVFPGLVFVPDATVRSLGLKPSLSGMIDLLMFGDWIATLDDQWSNKLISIVQIANTPRSERKALFDVGDQVAIVDGPFRGFRGEIDALDSKGRLSVGIAMFGRLQPVKLTEEQIEPV